jgi:hypothetical protein
MSIRPSSAVALLDPIILRQDRLQHAFRKAIGLIRNFDGTVSAILADYAHIASAPALNESGNLKRIEE